MKKIAAIGLSVIPATPFAIEVPFAHATTCGFGVTNGGAGSQGIIVITYTPAGGGGGNGATPARTIRVFEGFKFKLLPKN